MTNERERSSFWRFQISEIEQHLTEIMNIVAVDKEVPGYLLICPTCQGRLKVSVEPDGIGTWCIWISCENCGDVAQADGAGAPPASWLSDQLSV
jgi:hypothetical protein